MQNKMFNPTAQLDKAAKEETIKTKEKSPNESRKDNEGTSQQRFEERRQLTRIKTELAKTTVELWGWGGGGEDISQAKRF